MKSDLVRIWLGAAVALAIFLLMDSILAQREARYDDCAQINHCVPPKSSMRAT